MNRGFCAVNRGGVATLPDYNIWVLRRATTGFPAFWQLQIAGWICYYLSVCILLLPSIRQPGTLRGSSLFVAVLFAASYLMRFLCRYLMRRGRSWIALEMRAIACCIPAGAIAGLLIVVLTSPSRSLRWPDWLTSAMQSTFILFLWSNLYFSVKKWQEWERERERLLRAEAEARDARLSALRYQLNPHFLFNSLNAVSTLVLEGNAPAATRMLAQIGELLRTTLDGEGAAETALAQEIAFTEQYLAIEQTRLGDRLRVEMAISPETFDALVPSMLLQPLVENAVRHGVAPLVEGGTVRIQSRLNGSQLQVSIRNSGAPRAGIAAIHEPTHGIGLRNTAERLKTLYASTHTFVLQWPEAGGCEVTVELPFRKALLPSGSTLCVF
ncbi:MAG TPA: histidine kinase [Terracidiphilus sp.]|nr:histidine kinase [Terracidiphilus sp.]